MKKERNNDIEMVLVSKFIGSRKDWVQAGGGNTSIKLSPNEMYLKASGVSLSDVELEKGYVKVDSEEIRNFTEEVLNSSLSREEEVEKEKEIKEKSFISGEGYPSIELFLHAYFYRVVAHSHSLIVNAYTCQANWKEMLGPLFPEALFVPYATPGIRLAISIKKALDEYRKTYDQDPHIIFMQNHGLVVSYDSLEDTKKEQELVCKILEKNLNVDFSQAWESTQIQEILNDFQWTSYENPQFCSVVPSYNEEIEKILKNDPEIKSLPQFCPDGLVYCGEAFLNCTSLEDLKHKLPDFMEKYHTIKVILLNNSIYYVGPSVRKAMETEEVFEFFVKSVQMAGGKENVQYLPMEERHFLLNWDAEKYRQSK